MKLSVLASGSKGNCYCLENANECLIIEAGIPFLSVKKHLTFDVLKIVGVLVSHEHFD
jgi:phosphoribosyl 1,2-cyclic phosphodiesterase